VARIRNPSTSVSSLVARTAHTSGRCSQLSSTNNNCLPDKYSSNVSTGGRAE
jgi:hypothetical protein